jgi:hypothetical protein
MCVPWTMSGATSAGRGQGSGGHLWRLLERDGSGMVWGLGRGRL